MTVKSANFSKISIWISLPRGQREEIQAIIWRLHICIFISMLHVCENCFPGFWDLRLHSGRCCHPHPYLIALPGVETDVFLLTSALPTLSFLLQGRMVNWWKYFQIVTLALIYFPQVNNFFCCGCCFCVKKLQISNPYFLDGKVFKIL